MWRKYFRKIFNFAKKWYCHHNFKKQKINCRENFRQKNTKTNAINTNHVGRTKGVFLTPTIYLASIYSFLKGYQFKTRNFSRWKNIIKEIFLFSHLQLDSFGRLFLWSTVAIYYLAAQFYNICIIQHQLLMFIYIYIFNYLWDCQIYLFPLAAAILGPWLRCYHIVYTKNIFQWYQNLNRNKLFVLERIFFSTQNTVHETSFQDIYLLNKNFVSSDFLLCPSPAHLCSFWDSTASF